MSYVIGWINQGPFEPTPPFFDARPCPECGTRDSAKPNRLAPLGNAEAIRARCLKCNRESDARPTWAEALRAFYGDIPGRSPLFGPGVGARFKVKTCEPPVYPLKNFSPGDTVEMLDFETGRYSVRRLTDGLEGVIASQNIGEMVA